MHAAKKKEFHIHCFEKLPEALFAEINIYDTLYANSVAGMRSVFILLWIWIKSRIFKMHYSLYALSVSETRVSNFSRECFRSFVHIVEE